MSEDTLPLIVSRMFKIVAAAIVVSAVISIVTMMTLAAGLVYPFFQWI